VDEDLDGGEGELSDGSRGFWSRFLLPGGIWLMLMFLVPICLVLALSFGYTDDLGRAVYAFDLDNYSAAFDPLYIPVLLRSVGYAVATAALCLLLGYPIAYYIARYGGRRKHLLIALLVIPFFVNYLVRTYAWVALLADDGILNSLFKDIGLTESGIQFVNTPYAVIGGLVYGYLVFMILPVYASLERMDPALVEAGKDLFGTPFRTFIHVTLPQTKQGILAGCVLVFLPAVGDFVSAQLLGGPDTYMVGNLIQDQFFTASNWPFGSALTVVMMLFLSIWMFGYLRSAAREARNPVAA
jgi:spermidine/putrescine transport system permease protein